MPHPIKVHWLGLRKDTNKGSIWGWFTLEGKPDRILLKWEEKINDGPAECYVFWGKIGKSLCVEKRLLTVEFYDEISSKRKNFKEQDPIKVMSKWGKPLDDELGMFLLFEKIRG